MTEPIISVDAEIGNWYLLEREMIWERVLFGSTCSLGKLCLMLLFFAIFLSVKTTNPLRVSWGDCCLIRQKGDSLSREAEIMSRVPESGRSR